MVWRRKNAGKSSILGCEWASEIGKARKKTAGCTAGPVVRMLRLRGNMDGAVKPLTAWTLCSEPESIGGTPEVERLVGADELVWVAA